MRQRLAAHEHPEAVADALEVVPRSRPFERIAELAAIAVPTRRGGSRDEADPGHPLAVGERYAARDPRRTARGRGARAATAIADRVAGRAALAGAAAELAARQYVITYVSYAKYAIGTEPATTASPAPQEALGRGGARRAWI